MNARPSFFRRTLHCCIALFALVLFPLSSVLATDVTNGMFLYYSFDANNGAIVLDESGIGNTGTVSSATWTSGGYSGGAYSFDGVDDKIVVDRSSGKFDCDESSTFTMSAWVRPRNYVSGHSFVMVQQSTRGRFMWFAAVKEVDLTENYVSASAVVTYDSPLANDSWQHLVMVCDGGVLSCYIDGVLEGTSTWARGDIEPANGVLSIGLDVNFSGREFEGDIDEVRMYDRALSVSEITDLYGMPTGTKYDLTIAGNPADRGASSPNGYGVSSLDESSAVTESVASPVSGGSGIRYACSGWTGTGDVSATGSGTSASFTVTEASALTWQWITEYYLDVETSTNGSVDESDAWHALGAAVQLTATANTGYHFLSWSGDVPAGSESNNPLTVAMDQARALTAVFEVDAPGPQQDAVLYYSFDADGGSTVSDESGNGHHGAFSNASWTSSGVSGGGGRVPAEGLVKAPTSLAIDMTTSSDYTFSLWWKLDNESNANPIFFSKRVAGGGDIGLNLGITGFEDYRVHTRVNHWQKYAATLSAAVWHHAVFVKDGDSWTAYHDGQKLSAGATMGWPETVDVTQDLLPLLIGGEHTGGQEFDGTVDEVKIFDRALTAAEVSGLYDAPQQKSYTLAVAGNPQAIGTSAPNGYGSHSIPEDTSVTESVTSPVDGAAGVRYVCQGWTGEGSAPATGAGTSVSLTVALDSAITWNWLTQYYLDPDATTGGTVDVADGWQSDGASVVITATANTGYHFLSWSGDVPAGSESNNPLTVAMDQARALTAVFEVDAPGPQQDAVLYYSFDVNNGAAVADDSGNGHTGTVNSATWTASGRVGGAYSFDGVNDFVETHVLASDLGIDGSNQRTVSFWIKPDTVQSGFAFCVGDKRASLGLYGLKFRNDTMEFDNDYHSVGRWGGLYAPAKWSHVVIMYDGANVSLYVDGALTAVHSNPTGANSPLTLSTSDGLPLIIGAYSSPVLLFFDGLIDEFMVYNRTLSTVEVAALYSAAPLLPSGLTVSSAYGTPTPPVGISHYTPGDQVECSIASTVVTSGLVRYTCTGWSGTGDVPASGAGSSVVVTINDTSAIEWQWSAEYSLDLTVGSDGSVSGNAGWYSDGATAQLTATADVGKRFVGWTGDVPVSDEDANPLTLVMDQGRQVTALFEVGCSPDNDQVISNKRPQFAWLPVANAEWYQVWVDRDGNGYHSLWLEQTTTAYSPDFDFSPGSFKWWVQGWSKADGASTWAGPFTFSVPAIRPDRAAITSIPPGSEIPTNRPPLVWTPRDDDADPMDDADWYHFYMNKNGRRHQQKWIEGQTNCVLDTALDWGEYEWWVRGWNDDGYGPWSEGCPFTYGQPQTTGPTGTVTETRKPGLRWGQVDQATWYYLYMQKDGKAHTKTWLKGDTNYVSNADLSGGTYKWWVKSHKKGGGGLWSEKNEFEIPLVLPGQATHVTPLADTHAGVGSINYSWQKASDAVWHQLWISKDGGPWYAEWIDTTADGAQATRAIGGHASGHSYSWWIRAWNEDGYGAWSVGASFDAL